MTQLTFNHRSASAVRQQQQERRRDSSVSPEPALEGDANGYMARVRQNSHTGRRRHGSDQPDSQRNIKPKASTYHTQVPASPQPGQYVQHASTSVPYRRAHEPPPLLTTRWDTVPPNFTQTDDPGSHISYGASNIGLDAQDPFVSERNRTLSPIEYTPSQSVSSYGHSASQDGLSGFLHSGRKRSDSSSTNFLDRALHHGVSEPLAGIDAICDGDASDWSLPKLNNSNPPSAMMLPSALQHVRDLDEPWSPLELEDGCFASSPASPRPIPQSVHRANQPSAAPILRMPPRGSTRAGRRQGPLTAESRQNANDVRKERSCLRCFVYKETCDTSKDVCQNCSNKQARTWKLGCVRPRLMFRTRYLLPDVLASRLERKYVDSFIQHKGWTCRDKPRFAVPLEIGLGPHLMVPVREFLPVGDLHRPAYLPVDNGKQSTAVPITMYDLPVVISCDKEEEAANHIRHSLLRWFQQTIECTHEGDWAWHWFNKQSDPFAGGVMKLICEYFKANAPQHRILKEALALSFFNYIFIYSFNIPDEHVPILQQRVEAQIPQGAEYISPSIINLYIKMLMLPALRDVVKRTLKGLEQLLLDQQNGRLWRRDLIFCVSFIVLAYLGRTQVSVLQFASQPTKDQSKALSPQAAAEQIMEMEQEVADLIIKYHTQFLTPSPRRKASNIVATEAEQRCEEHAQQFNLTEKVRSLRAEHLDSVPESFAPQCAEVGDFIANNTTRICWKFVQAVLPDAEVKKDPDTDMAM